uniref:NADP-dependent oxidoreductase domain-containing protein n=1 Tax=Octactis speculum TaxID=3111310 RepID=A0A7S2H8S5_9STRA|mmetsp:Transcript_62465/g.85845  ORF Transcript_62465/g.85845 Transcript_62465/m.85845 type:complete len:344 (+) Transcript_62465:3-1034(+)
MTRRFFFAAMISTISQREAVSSDFPAAIPLFSGDKMPLVGLGTWESKKVASAVRCAITTGCNHIDCASAYRNQKEIGTELVSLQGKHPRSSLWLTSKLWNDRRRPADVRDALEQTLRELQTEYLDLYLIHWPVVWARGSVMKPDASASLQETWRTLEALVDEGKVRNIGVSNYNEVELRDLLSYARIKPAVNQVELHPRLPQVSLVNFCAQNGIAVTAYSPLGRGDLKGASLLSDPIVGKIAKAHAVSPASVILRWNLERGVAVIPKSVTPSRIRSNAREPLTFALDRDEISELNGLADGVRFCTAPWSTFDDRTPVDRAVSTVLRNVASAVFSVASVDITSV